MNGRWTPDTARVREWYATWPTTTIDTRVVPEYLAEFDRWLAGERARVLREAAEFARQNWTRTTNLPDLDDPEVAYSFDRWLDVLADRMARRQA